MRKMRDQTKGGQAATAGMDDPATDHDTPTEAAQTTFSSHGNIPPVMTEETNAGPSASDQAFGGAQRMRVQPTALNVRTAPAMGNNVVGVLHHGTELSVAGHAGEWVKVSHRGLDAYVHGRYVQPIKHEAEPDPRAVYLVEKHVEKASSDTADDAAQSIEPPAKIAPPAGPVDQTGDHDQGAAAPVAEEHHDAPVTQPSPPKADSQIAHIRTPVHDVAERANEQVAHGEQSQHGAIQQIIDADYQQNGGALSELGMQIIAGVLAAFGEQTKQAEAAKAEPDHVPTTQATVATQPKQAVQPASPPTRTPAKKKSKSDETTAGQAYLSSYTSLGGTKLSDLKTTRGEANILNGLRHKSERFDPAWLARAQATLGVSATGAMSTETVRAMLAQRPNLDADKIVSNDGGYLSTLASGEPFIKTEEGFGTYGEKDRKEAKGKFKADRAARRLGYEDYDDYWSNLEPDATFLGKTIKEARLHPHIVQRLQVAQTWLRQRHPGLDDAHVRSAIGWNGAWNASYDADKKSGKSHFHTMGLAIDIDASHNGYVLTGRKGAVTEKDDEKTKQAKEGAEWLMSLWERHTKNAATIFGGEGISAATMASWSDTESTEEMWAKIHTTSESWKKYLDLAKNPAKAKEEFTKHGLSADDLEQLTNSDKLTKWWRSGGRSAADRLTTHSQELLVALRDIAGLSWGGAEMSSNENGDFMHFDCRHDTFGKNLYAFNNGK